MKFGSKKAASIIAAIIALFISACSDATDETGMETTTTPVLIAEPPVRQTPAVSPMPDLQAEILDDRFKKTGSPIGSYDFTNHTYPLPRGWQNPDSSEITLSGANIEPIAETFSDDMSNEERAELRAARRIGMSFGKVKYFDVTGDGIDEAIVILKIETAGAAIPQVAYFFEWKDGRPELIWHFRTGDRADGGLKDIRPAENGEVVVELYGQDRFILGEVETGKITGDEEQLCCPTFFTRSAYKYNGTHFLRQGDRLTIPTSDPFATPIENFGEIMNDPIKSKEYLEKQEEKN